MKKALYFLRDGNWLTVLFDQNGGHAGSDAMFLNRLTSVTTFPDLLAKVNNLRVVYALPRRIGFFKTHLSLKEILPSKDKPISIQAHDLLALPHLSFGREHGGGVDLGRNGLPDLVSRIRIRGCA